jgi:hypothetical protein
MEALKKRSKKLSDAESVRLDRYAMKIQRRVLF